MKICALIPAFNVASTIQEVILRTQKVIPAVVVIDDGSQDKTAYHARQSGAHVLAHTTNQGKGAALKDGFQYALDHHYEAVVILDSDGQHDPDDIQKLLARASDADIVIGSRMSQHQTMPKPMVLTNRFLSCITSIIARQKIHDSQSGFRLIKAPVLKQLSLTTNHYEMETEQLIKAGQNGFIIKETPIKTIYTKRSVRKTIVMDTLRFIRLFLSPSLYFYKKI